MATPTTTSADQTLTAEILGHRTNHPRLGPHSDIRVKFSDGTIKGPFAYYGDAYEYARMRVAPESITRRGRRASAKASPAYYSTGPDHWARIDEERAAS